jgi:hypothetical protein
VKAPIKWRQVYNPFIGSEVAKNNTTRFDLLRFGLISLDWVGMKKWAFYLVSFSMVGV